MSNMNPLQHGVLPPFQGHNPANLPPELVDLIFRHVDGDKQTLVSCLQVCRSWSICAHPYAFKDLVVWVYVGAIHARSWQAGRTLEHFLQFLRETPRFARSLVSLKVTDDGPIDDDDVERLDLCLLQDTLLLLPALQALHISVSGCVHRDLEIGDTDDFGGTGPSASATSTTRALHTLEIWIHQTSHLERDLRAILGLCCEVEKLAIHTSCLGDPEPSEAPLQGPFRTPEIHDLEIYPANEQRVQHNYNVLYNIFGSNKLTSITYCPERAVDSGDVPFGDFLEKAGHSLTDFTYVSHGSDGSPANLMRNRCPNLVRLDIPVTVIAFEAFEDLMNVITDGFANAVSSLSDAPPTLTECRWDVMFLYLKAMRPRSYTPQLFEDVLNALQWQELVNVLETHTHIETLEIDISYAFDDEDGGDITSYKSFAETTIASYVPDSLLCRRLWVRIQPEPPDLPENLYY